MTDLETQLRAAIVATCLVGEATPGLLDREHLLGKAEGLQLALELLQEKKA